MTDKHTYRLEARLVLTGVTQDVAMREFTDHDEAILAASELQQQPEVVRITVWKQHPVFEFVRRRVGVEEGS